MEKEAKKRNQLWTFRKRLRKCVERQCLNIWEEIISTCFEIIKENFFFKAIVSLIPCFSRIVLFHNHWIKAQRRYLFLDKSKMGCMSLDKSKMVCMSLDKSKIGFMSLDKSKMGCMSLDKSKIGFMSMDKSKMGWMSLDKSKMGCMSLDKSKMGFMSLDKSKMGFMSLDKSKMGFMSLDKSKMGCMSCHVQSVPCRPYRAIKNLWRAYNKYEDKSKKAISCKIMTTMVLILLHVFYVFKVK